MANGSLTAYPGAHKTDSYSWASTSNMTNPVGKGSDNTTYAQITLISDSNAETFVYWPFDLSAIPNGATIVSVECKAKATINNTTSTIVAKRTMQLCTDGATKGSTSDIGSSASIISLSCGTWTREELQSCSLKLYAKRGTGFSMSTCYIRFYGADLTVTYTYNAEKFMLKTGGAWADVARVFKKVNGIWVEQTELSSVVEDGVRYQNGGEIISPKKTVTITGTGDNNASTTEAECYVEINGVKYVSATTVEVDSGTTMLCYAYANLESITLNGSSVGSGTPKQYTHTVNENCTVKLSVEVSLISKATIDITTQ